jgi:hypothetical protein
VLLICKSGLGLGQTTLTPCCTCWSDSRTVGDESAGGAGGEGGGALRAITPPERPRPAPALSDSAASPDTGGGELLGNGNSPQGQASSRQPGSGQQDQLQPLKRSSLPGEWVGCCCILEMCTNLCDKGQQHLHLT